MTNLDNIPQLTAAMSSNNEDGPLQGEVCQDKPEKRSTGPRTERGKKASSRNALKHGFFAKELVIDPNDRASKRELSNLINQLNDEWNPVGPTERLQIELVAIAAIRLREFFRWESARIYEACPSNDEFLRNIKQHENESVSTDSREAARQRTSAIVSRIEEMKAKCPPILLWDNAQRSRSHVLNMYYRAVAGLQQLQEIRAAGKPQTNPN